MKQCHICKEMKPYSEYNKNRAKRDRHDHRCKDCLKEQRKIVEAIRVHAPDKSSSCDCCGKMTETIGLDHCHQTNTFRGWLCADCNQGLGKLGDTFEAITKVMGYLSKHKYMLDRGELDDERTGIGYRDGSETQYDLDLRN